MHYRIERLEHPVSEDDIDGLALLLAETVNSGSAVSFLAPLDVASAARWWRQVFSDAGPEAVFLVARTDERIVGTVQLHPSWAPNQPHRADVAKLIVSRDHRGSGIGARLMSQLEREADAAGFNLLTLDTKQGDAAERLYRKLGWIEVGAIPRYALDPDGRSLHATVLFYKELGTAAG